MNYNKKIGIISYWDSLSNYGQILQGVALQYILRHLGYNPVTIKYILPQETDKISIFERIKKVVQDDVSILKHIQRKIKHIFNRRNIEYDLNCNIPKRKFIDFKQKYLHLTENKYTTIQQIATIAPDFYAFITGSDQVWHEAGNYERMRVFLLDFTSSTVRRLSYAASFGRDRISDKAECLLFQKCLAKFDGVSVRENTGVNICRLLQRPDAIKMPDPTLLLTKEEWFSYLHLNTNNDKIPPKAFFYSLKAYDQRIHSLIRYFETKGYEINYVCSDTIIDKSANKEATIEEWLQLIATSNIVITNSFHGTIFSLNFNTPVISIGNKDYSLEKGSNQRMYSIMKELNLSDFFINDVDTIKTEKIVAAKINWETINQYIELEREKGIAFLKTKLH